jgi:hypothetical protein
MEGWMRSAEQLQLLSAADQDEAFEASLIRDPSDVPEDLQPLAERGPARVQSRIADPDVPSAR